MDNAVISMRDISKTVSSMVKVKFVTKHCRTGHPIMRVIGTTTKSRVRVLW